MAGAHRRGLPPRVGAIQDRAADRTPRQFRGIQATAQEGRAWARLGEGRDTYDAIERVHRLAAPRPRPERPEHHYRYDPTKVVAYTATTLAWVGDAAAEDFAREIIARLSRGGDTSRWPRRVASANIDLALALLATGRLDEAAASVFAAMLSGMVVPSNHWRALEVVRGIEDRGLSDGRELHDAYEQMRRAAGSISVASSPLDR